MSVGFEHACRLGIVALCLVASSARAEDAATFDVWELRVLHNSVLETREVERAVYPFLGPAKTFKDVDAARAALEKVYHDRGYGTVFVDIPEQSVDSGIVRLNVTEGKLNAVRMTGARYFSGRQIRAELPEAHTAAVLHLPSLQAQLTEVNSVSSDRVVTPVLKAGNAPGTVDLTLRVEEHLPFHGSLELNNQYTTDTSHLRALGSLSYSNLFQRFDSVSLQYQRAPQELSEVDVLVASYMARVGSWRWALSYLHSASEVASVAPSAGTSGSPSSLLVIGKGSVYGAHFILPLPGSSSLTHSFTLGADYKDFLEAINAQATDPTKAVDLTTPISYMNLSMGYGGFWRGAVHQASLDTSVNFGVRGLGNSEVEFESKRFRGRPNYFYLRSALTFGSHLPYDFTLLTRLAGQYAVEPVVSNEQFSIAGADGVRGFLEAEELADTGIKAGVQLGTPQWAPFGGRLRADAFTFYDIGRIGVVDPLPGEPSNTSLRSWGAGLNLAAFDHITGTLTWAYALTDGSVTFRGDSMLLFTVRSGW